MREIPNYSRSKSTAAPSTNRSFVPLNRSKSTYNVSAPATPNFWPTPALQYGLRRSSSSNVIESQRGFKPSDRKDPTKREFLADLTKRVFKVGLVSRHEIRYLEMNFSVFCSTCIWRNLRFVYEILWEESIDMILRLQHCFSVLHRFASYMLIFRVKRMLTQ